jgi:hypothetical protein
MSTRHPWKLFRNGSEIVFPLGARRRIQASVVPIPNAGGIERTIDGEAVWTGAPSFKRHAITLSCTDMTAAPIANLWPGDPVVLHSPDEMSVPGPVATLDYDPVPGTVYGVDATDTPVGSTASGSRFVNIPGAVAIRFRPIMSCIVESKDTRGTQGKADAGWTLALQELAGSETSNDDGDRVSFGAPGLQSFEVGEAGVLELAPLVATNTGLPVFYAVASGELPPGMVLNGATGQISGIPTAAGLYVVVVMAASGTVNAVQTIPFFAEVVEPTVALAAADLQSFVVGTAYSLDLELLTTIENSTDAATYSVVGGALPPGLSLNASTGVISGTPTADGAYAVTIQAALPTGQAARETYAFYDAPAGGDDFAGPYVVATGGTVRDYTDSAGRNWREHRFTASGNFVVTDGGDIEYRIVSGGGGGGTSQTDVFGGGGGGGGGGGWRRLRNSVSPGTHAVVIGAGGVGGTNSTGNRHGRRGTASSFLGISPPAGGGGAGTDGLGTEMSGGSGGGGRAPATGGAGTAYFGNSGGNQVVVQNNVSGSGGGGGGAGGPGGVATTTSAASGGPGMADDITGTTDHRAGGGAGTPFSLNYGAGGTNPATPSLPYGTGGIGGGGACGVSGTANTGGGGGATVLGTSNAGAGGSGEVIIRYRRP